MSTPTVRPLFGRVALHIGVRMLCDADLRRVREDVQYTAERTTVAEVVLAVARATSRRV